MAIVTMPRDQYGAPLQVFGLEDTTEVVTIDATGASMAADAPADAVYRIVGSSDFHLKQSIGLSVATNADALYAAGADRLLFVQKGERLNVVRFDVDGVLYITKIK